VTHPLMMKRACESAASGRVQGRSVDDVGLPGPTRVLDVSRTRYSSQVPRTLGVPRSLLLYAVTGRLVFPVAFLVLTRVPARASPSRL
jgi:hypothetical protein